MAWETRGGRKYFTRSARKDGKVTREYFGNGTLAELIAEADRQLKTSRRARREAQEEAHRQVTREMAPIEAALDCMEEFWDVALDTVLNKAGFHLHRGTWRRIR